MVEEIFETHDAKIWLRKDGVIHISTFPHVETNLDDAIDTINFISNICKKTKKKKHPVIVDIRQVKNLTRDARNYFSGEEAHKYVTALAILVGSPVSRILGNFFMGMNKPLYPVKLFTDEEKAIKWLKNKRRLEKW